MSESYKVHTPGERNRAKVTEQQRDTKKQKERKLTENFPPDDKLYM